MIFNFPDDFLDDLHFTRFPRFFPQKQPPYRSEELIELSKLFGKQIAQLQRQIDECREDIKLLYDLYYEKKRNQKTGRSVVKKNTRERK